MASSPSQTLPGTQARRTGKLKKISLIPFVAILYAYCAGGPFDYEAMVSTSGPGMALLFILIVPWLFSVPMALASAEMATAMPVEASVYLGFTHAHFNRFHPWMPPRRPWREVYGVGLALALWIYSGYEQLSTVIEEVEEPARNFPRGLAIVVPVAAVVFFLAMAAGLAALGNWKEWQTAYLVTAGRLLGGTSMEWAMFGGAAICAFVLLDATVLSVSRVPFTMAEDGFLHSSLAQLHPRFGTPVLAIVISTVFCSLLALGSVTQLIAIYAWMRSATSVLTLFSLWQLRRVAPEMKRSFVVPGGKAGLAAVVVIPTALFAWALINSDPASRLWGIPCLALGPVAYYFGK